MNTYRKTAIIVGILFIVCTVSSILGRYAGHFGRFHGLSQSYWLAIQIRSSLAALLEFIWAAAVRHSIGLYPLLKKHNEVLALGPSCSGLESIVLIGAQLLSLLTLVRNSLQQDPLKHSFQTWARVAVLLFDR